LKTIHHILDVEDAAEAVLKTYQDFIYWYFLPILYFSGETGSSANSITPNIFIPNILLICPHITN
jgi:hypothetical protein